MEIFSTVPNMNLKKFNRTLIKTHRFLGLILAINFLILTVTGTLLIWKEEMQDARSPENSKEGQESGNLAVFGKIEHDLKKNYPSKKILAIFRDEERSINARVTAPDVFLFRGALKLNFDEKGDFRSDRPVKGGFWEFTLKLHREIYLGGTGKILLGILGCFMFLTLLTGLGTAPQFSRAKKRADWRAKLGEWHRLAGRGTFSWLLIVTVTGIFLSFNNTLITLFIKNSMNQHQISQANLASHLPNYVSVSKVVQEIKFAYPHFEIDFISYPDNEFSLPGQFVVLLERENEKQGEKKIVVVDGFKGKLTTILALPWYIEFLILSGPLHFGNYGGVLLKLAWTLLGLLSTVLPLTGFLIFLGRRKIITFPSRPLRRPGFVGAILWKFAIRPPPSAFLIVAPFIFVIGSWFSGLALKYLLSFLFLLFGLLIFWPLTINGERET